MAVHGVRAAGAAVSPVGRLQASPRRQADAVEQQALRQLVCVQGYGHLQGTYAHAAQDGASVHNAASALASHPMQHAVP